MTLRRPPVLETLGHDDARRLGTEWDDLMAESTTRTPFLTWPWVSAWLDTIGREADLEIHVARDADDGRLLGVAPFHVVATRRGGIRVRELRLVGSGRAAPDHLDLLLRHETADQIGPALWASVQRGDRWDLIDLDGVVADGHLHDLVLRRSADEAELIPAPYLPLSSDWDEVTSRWGRSHRQNIGRYSRKLDAEAGAPVTERLVATAADLDTTLDHLIVMHQAIRTSKGDTGLFGDDDVTGFLRTAAHRLLDAGRLRMWRLDVGPEPAAVIWCMRAFDTVAFYTTGFDARWGKYGPGRRIMARAIEGAASEGATEFDFLRGDESYKRSWGTEMRHDVRLRRPASGRGRVVWMLRSAVRVFRRSPRADS